MREILFRGKDINTHNWIYGNFNKIQKLDYSSYEFLITVAPETIGQYTGLTDKNGTKIFENGYLIIDKQTYKVEFNNGEYILTNIFNCDVIQLKDNSSIGVFIDEI